MAPIGSLLWRPLRIYQIFGANTEVGKTVFTTLLLRTANQQFQHERASFLKPVSTGPLLEADDCHAHKFAPGSNTHTLFQFDLPVSPHIAARLSNKSPPSDDALLARIRDHAASRAAESPGWLFVETAGGVHSPGPSGTTQADLYMPLRLPVVLVGDSKLGGISQTISAFESLRIRGYDVEAVLLFKDQHYENYKHLTAYLWDRYSTPVKAVDEPPQRADSKERDAEIMVQYYSTASNSPEMHDVLSHLEKRHDDRLARLESIATKAHEHVWYPFTQQKGLTPDKLTVIDSACGNCFHTLTPPSTRTNPEGSFLQPSFDGSASWWTQGLGHGNPQLTVAAAYAAGRYGHVIFAETVHEPAVALAENLLTTIANPRLTRVFYSDNGSTGVEVAVKMGLRAARVRYGWGTEKKIGVLGLKDGYHGDTIGAMDCAEPCVFNEKVEWYEGKGFWFDYPTIKRTSEGWVVRLPELLQQQDSGPVGAVFPSLDEIFDHPSRDGSVLAGIYESYITETVKRLQKQGRKFGALIIEPVVLGAGGMAFVDPLFQRVLVNTIRRSAHLIATSKPRADDEGWSGLPIIADEVFTGLYRLGHATSSSLLGIQPDISVHAKLLTGGLVPLCATLASDSIFRAFESDDKSDALLHGHSYTAHPVGCQVALESLKTMRKMVESGEQEWMDSRTLQAGSGKQPAGQGTFGPRSHEWSLWSDDFVNWLANQTSRVDGVWALGTVLAIHMKSQDGAGYKSTAAVDLRNSLLRGAELPGAASWNVHSRVLGNVLYIMGALTTSKGDVEELQSLVRRALQ